MKIFKNHYQHLARVGGYSNKLSRITVYLSSKGKIYLYMFRAPMISQYGWYIIRRKEKSKLISLTLETLSLLCYVILPITFTAVCVLAIIEAYRDFRCWGNDVALLIVTLHLVIFTLILFKCI